MFVDIMQLVLYHKSILFFNFFFIKKFKDCGKINTGEIVCPYHGWTYTLEGNLKKATQIRGIENFNSKNNSLFPIHVQTFGLWVFIHLGI